MSNQHSLDTLYQKKLTQKRNKTTDLLHKNTNLNTNERKNGVLLIKAVPWM
jgi:hypothetical protein